MVDLAKIRKKKAEKKLPVASSLLPEVAAEPQPAPEPTQHPALSTQHPSAHASIAR